MVIHFAIRSIVAVAVVSVRVMTATRFVMIGIRVGVGIRVRVGVRVRATVAVIKAWMLIPLLLLLARSLLLGERQVGEIWRMTRIERI
jgi:hypothetical protein